MSLLPRLSLLLIFVTFSAVCSAQEVTLGSPFATDEVDRAVDRALDYLISQQNGEGAIKDRQHDTTMTALAIMAFASVGTQTQDPGPRGVRMRKALDFVLRDDRVTKKGYFGERDGSRMYGHGITSLMLTEMLGMGADENQDRLIQKRCQDAINVILSAQNHKKQNPQDKGGWRYTPESPDSDLSVSVWQLMALRSAKNDGLEVPSSAIDDAVNYLRRSYTAPLDSDGNPPPKLHGFSYTPGQSHPTYTMTAAGLLAMQVCGEYESPLVKFAADWLTEHPPKYEERFFFYGTYYFAQGMYQRGGKHAESAERLVRDLLLPKQQANGSWVAQHGEENGAGNVYATCLAILSLSVKYHYLPIYQK